MIQVVGLRYVPFFPYVDFLGVTHTWYLVVRNPNRIPAYHVPTENTANLWGQYRIAHIRSVPPRLNYFEVISMTRYAPVASFFCIHEIT